MRGVAFRAPYRAKDTLDVRYTDGVSRPRGVNTMAVHIQHTTFDDALALNDFEEASTTLLYLGSTTPQGAYRIERIDLSDGIVIGYASAVNNPSVTTYSAAWTARATLTYGDRQEA